MGTTISFSLPDDKQELFERFKRTVFGLKKQQGEAIAEAIQDFNIKHSIMSAAETGDEIAQPKTCVELLLETEPKELRKIIFDTLKTDSQCAKLKGHGYTISQEADKVSMALYRNARDQTPIRIEKQRNADANKDHQKIDESQYLMPVLQGDADEE